MSCAFIEEKYLRLTIEGACKQQTLLLSAGQRTAHITNKTIVGHRHHHDFIVYACHSCAFYHSFPIRDSLIEADIIGYRTGQELVVLHDRPYLLPINLQTD